MLSSLSSPSTISMFSAVEDLQDDSLAPLLTHHAAFEETLGEGDCVFVTVFVSLSLLLVVSARLSR